MLHVEHVMVELLLKFLIGIVDAKLLERVQFEDFEAENVQNAYEFQLFPWLSVQFLRYWKVDAFYYPVKELIIDSFGHSISSSIRFFHA